MQEIVEIQPGFATDPNFLGLDVPKRKIATDYRFNQLRFSFVALEGFEPSQAEPESDVLPLHHKAVVLF